MGMMGAHPDFVTKKSSFSRKHTGRNPGFDRVLIEDLSLEEVVFRRRSIRRCSIRRCSIRRCLLENVY